MSKTALVLYTISAITGGMYAQCEISCRLKEKGHVDVWRSSNQDIITASTKVFVNGLYRLELMKLDLKG